MKRNISTTAVVALALTTSMGLAACGRSTDTAKAGDKAASVSSGKATGTITVWAMGSEGDNLPKLTKDFEAANPGVKVVVTAIPWDAAHDKFATAITAGKTPDAAMVGTTWMGEFAKQALDPRSTRASSSKAHRRPPRLAGRRSASPGMSRPASSTTARTWPRRQASRPFRPTWPA